MIKGNRPPRATTQKFQKECITTKSVVEIKQNHKKYWIHPKIGEKEGTNINKKRKINSEGSFESNYINRNIKCRWSKHSRLNNVRLDFKKARPNHMLPTRNPVEIWRYRV